MSQYIWAYIGFEYVKFPFVPCHLRADQKYMFIKPELELEVLMIHKLVIL